MIIFNKERLIDGRSIDISLGGGIHNIVGGSEVGRVQEEPVALNDWSGVITDGTGVKQEKGKKKGGTQGRHWNNTGRQSKAAGMRYQY